ncbi:MAG: DUF6602 domain-containing protein [Virgibacillus proomii]|jgi:hypothetical protein
MDTFQSINKHYQRIATAISSQLQLETPNHHGISGTSRELIWLDVFESLVPKKFKLAQSVFIMDSFGQISAEVDIAIYDEQYTPYVFNYGNMQFIPIEAVAAVVQSKSRTMDEETLDDVTAWARTIYKLKPVLNAYVRTHQGLLDTAKSTEPQTQTSTRPLIILCTLHSLKTDQKNDDISSLPELKRNFDFILHLDKEQQFQLIVDQEKASFTTWYEVLNHYDLERYNAEYAKLNKLKKHIKEESKERKLTDLQVFKEKDKSAGKNPLLTFMFQFNQLLMIINNPMFFPHQAYVNMFNQAIEKQEKKDCVKKREESKDDFLLAVYDITGIQDYIFATNRLKENIGASYIVGEMVEKHFVDMLKESVGKNKKHLLKTSWDNECKKVTIFNKKNVKAEVVYIGGGNALVVYRDWKLYHKVNRKFAIKVLEESASLTMVTEAIPFSLKEKVVGSYAKLYKELMQKLSDTKAKMVRTTLNQTLPIFAQEPFKGDPITHHVDKMNVSTEQWLKRKANHHNTSELFVEETEDLKRKKGEDSYIGVVHIDGNGMGEWISYKLSKTGKDFTSAIKKHRKLSLQITEYFRETFKKTVEKFVKKTDVNTQNHSNKEDKLPLRPLILDGDDVTFICQGDLAIPFTLEFLKQLKNGEHSNQISACAGVAFVHSHFPFDLAYDIAEQCCQNAKHVYYQTKKPKNEKNDNEKEECYFDFYLVRGSYVQTMEEQRKNQTDLDSKIYNVAELEKLYQMIRWLNSDDEKVWPHSRLIALYEAYLQNRDAVDLVNLEAESRGYKKIEATDERLLFDALQLLDFGKEQEWKICRNIN